MVCESTKGLEIVIFDSNERESGREKGERVVTVTIYGIPFDKLTNPMP